jgi:hypothetical protein
MSDSNGRSNTRTQSLKRAYQFLLHAYPRQIRLDRGAVELDTLLSVSKPNQRLPKIAEARAITREGIRERIRSTAGQTPLEVLAHGGALGVLFTMSLQLYALGILASKAAQTPNESWTRSAPLTMWIASTVMAALWWSLRPSRLALLPWQFSNVIGTGWLVGYVSKHATHWSHGLQVTMVTFGTIACLLSLSSVLAMFCWSKLPNQSRAPLGWKIAVPSIAVPIWASPLFGGIEKHGNSVLLLAIVAMLVIAFVDPRPLIGLAIAVITPLASGTFAIISSDTSGTLVRILLPTITVLAIGTVALRTRSLVRRLNR